MLNDFLSTIKSGLGDQLAGNNEIDSSKLDGVADVVTDTFKEGMVEKFKGGKIGDIAGLLGQGGSSSPFAGSLVNNVVGNLVSKIGLSQGISSTIAKVAVPFIIDKFSGFAKDKGVENEDGVGNLMGDLVKGSLKDKLFGVIGKKLGF